MQEARGQALVARGDALEERAAAAETRLSMLELSLARFNHSISNADVLQQLGKVEAHLSGMASGLNASVTAMRSHLGGLRLF